MARFAFVALAGVVLLTGGASAQNAPAAQNGKVTVSGCVGQAPKDGSLAAKSSTTATANTAPMEANNPEVMNVYMLLDAAPVGSAPSRNAAPAGGGAPTYTPSRTSYALSGHEAELAKQSGHRVEIVGSIVPTIGAGRAERKGVVADGVQRIRVESIKSVPGTCSAPAPAPKK